MGLYPYRHADRAGLRLGWLKVRYSKRPERSDNRRFVTVCESQVRIRRGGRVWMMVQTTVTTREEFRVLGMASAN